jgi:hypothetical protein
MSADTGASEDDASLADDFTMEPSERYARAAAAAQIAAARGNVQRMRKATQLQRSLLEQIAAREGDQ